MVYTAVIQFVTYVSMNITNLVMASSPALAAADGTTYPEPY